MSVFFLFACFIICALFILVASQVGLVFGPQFCFFILGHELLQECLCSFHCLFLTCFFQLVLKRHLPLAFFKPPRICGCKCFHCLFATSFVLFARTLSFCFCFWPFLQGLWFHGLPHGTLLKSRNNNLEPNLFQVAFIFLHLFPTKWTLVNFGQFWSNLIKFGQILVKHMFWLDLTKVWPKLTKIDQIWPKLTKTEKYGFVPDKMGPIDFIIVLKLFFVGNGQKHFL